MNTPIVECHNLTKCYDPAGRIGLKNINLVLYHLYKFNYFIFFHSAFN